MPVPVPSLRISFFCVYLYNLITYPMDEYRNIDISAWTKVGEGGNGTVYENPSEPDVILKVNKAGINTLAFVSNEYKVSRAVEGLGIQVPKMYEIVKVGDAYATLSQRIRNKKSFSRTCQENPDRTEEMARVLCEKGKELFRTPCNTDIFPSRKEQLLRAIGKARFIGKKNREIIAQFARTIPEEKTCVHGDFSMANIIVSEGNYYWIDLDRFGYGDPMFDIGHLFQICNVYSSMKLVQDIFHMSEEQLKRFWTAFAKAYTGEETPEAFNRLAGKFACLDLVVRNEFQKPSLVESLFFASYIRNHVKNYF